jgi:hypothetical protein
VVSVPGAKAGGGAKSVNRPAVVAKEPAVASVASAKPGCVVEAVKEPAVASVASAKPGCAAKWVSQPAMAYFAGHGGGWYLWRTELSSCREGR